VQVALSDTYVVERVLRHGADVRACLKKVADGSE
jgi:hypothetical protein